jgi:hypothetical protein
MVGNKSRLHSLTPKRAKQKRKLVQSPDFNNYQDLRYTSPSMATKASVRVAVGIVCCWGFAFAALLFFYAVAPWTDHRAIAFFGSRPLDTVLFGTAGLISVFVIARLIQGQTLGLVDGIRGEHPHARIGSSSSVFRAARTDRFRTF